MKINTFQWENLIQFSKRKISLKTPELEVVSYKIQTLKRNSNLHIVFISDTHFGKYSPPANKIITLINDLNPDYIIFGGDIASESSGLQDAFEFLSSIKAKYAKISVLGNWELKRSRFKNSSYWRANYLNAGFELLHNRFIETEDCIIYGISPKRRFHKGSTNIPKTEKAILFCAHSPDDIVSEDSYFDLALSGHTHAGQIRIPLFGALKTSSIYWKKFEYGLFKRNDGAKLIVSSGIGTSCLPIRIFCPPEIVSINLC